MLPTLLEKQSFRREKEYVTSSHGEVETLVLTSVDLELFFKHYEVHEDDLVWKNGFKFQGKLHLFDKYIEKWSNTKIEAKKAGNKGLYKIAKIMLNSLYGKFGSNPNVGSKSPFLNEDDIVKYHTEKKEIRDSIYIPMASFITAYARKKTIETSQKIKEYSLEKYGEDYYVYSDTDSCHIRKMPLEELKQIIEVDPYKLGAWDLEAEPEYGKYIRQKTYMDYIDKSYQITCAGMSKNGIKYNEDKSKIYYKVYGTNMWVEFNIEDFKPRIYGRWTSWV